MRKIYYGLILVFIIPIRISAQDNISLHFAQVYSSFRYQDSQGNKDENLSKNIKYSYGVNYSKNFKSNIFLKPELGYKNFGAMSNFNNTNIEWNLHYIDMNLACGYQINAFRLKPYGSVAGYISYLYKGDQIIGSESYDLVSTNTLSSVDYGVVVSAGCKYAFSDYASIFFEYRNTIGLCQLDNNTNGGTKEVYNRASSIHFGLSFNINTVKSE